MAKTPRPSTDVGVYIGQILLGKYRVEEMLGQGGMGIVARCTHLLSDAQVAIKMLRPDVLSDQDATARFMREAQAAVKLRSEYVAHVHDVGTLETGVPYMVMEFLDGHDLGQLLEQQHHVQVQWAVDMMLQAAEALAEAHSISIVHRDVKPTNLFVTWRPDGTSLIKVLDFGISKSPMGTDMQLTQTQSLLGTPAYMSPEQMRSARLVDARTDVWSLGTVMYELIEGRRPFDAESFSEMCVKVAVDQPIPMEKAPPELQQVVLRCLAKSPDQRYSNMAELGRDLIPFARDPHQAAMLVERMTRMLGRSSATTWESSSNSDVQRLKTPVPGVLRTPIPGHVANDGTMKERSAPAVLPLDVSMRRRRWPVFVGVGLLFAALGVGGVVFYRQSVGDDETVAKPQPAITQDNVAGEPTKTVPPEPPKDPPIKADAVVPPPPIDPKPAVAVEEKPKATDTVVKKRGQKKKAPPVVKKDPPVEKPDKDKLVPPPEVPKPKTDVFSSPRPEFPKK